MRRSPDFACPAAVLGPDGRVEPFDGARLAVSLRRALVSAADERGGTGARHRANDLAAVVGLFLSRDEQGPLVGRAEVADLGRRLLLEAGHQGAAAVYEARRCRARAGAGPRRWERATLPLAEMLSDGAPGSAVDRRLAAALIRDHALRHVLPSDVVAAQQDGWLDFLPWMAGARVVEAVLPRGWAARQGSGRPPRSAVLGAALRPLVGLVVEDLILPWEGALPGARAAQDLAHQLVTTDPSAGRVVVSLAAQRVAQRPARQALHHGLIASLDASPRARWALRIHGPCAQPRELAELTCACPRVEVGRTAPPSGCVSAAARVDLLRLARTAGAGRPGVFLELMAEAVQLAQRGLSAWADSEPVMAAWQALAPSLGDGAIERVRIDLAGWADARRMLLGDGVRARANGDDLAAALGERLSREASVVGSRELMLVASAVAPEDAAEVTRLTELLRLCPGAALPVSTLVPALAPDLAEQLYRFLLGRSPTLAGSGSCV